MKRIPIRQEVNRPDLSKQDVQVLNEKRTFAQPSVLLYVSAPHGMELRAASAQINQSWLAWLTYRDVRLEGVSATGVLPVKKMILAESRRVIFPPKILLLFRAGSVRCIAVLHFHTFSVFPLQCLKCIRIPWYIFCSAIRHGHLVCSNTIMWKCVMTKWRENSELTLQRGIKREELETLYKGVRRFFFLLKRDYKTGTSWDTTTSERLWTVQFLFLAEQQLVTEDDHTLSISTGFSQ